MKLSHGSGRRLPLIVVPDGGVDTRRTRSDGNPGGSGVKKTGGGARGKTLLTCIRGEGTEGGGVCGGGRGRPRHGRRPTIRHGLVCLHTP